MMAGSGKPSLHGGFLRGIAVAAAVALVLALPLAAMAGRGGPNSAPAWISLSSVDGTALDAVAEPSLGSWVAFSTSYAKNTKNPWVSLMCYQEGTVVYGEGGGPDHEFLLGGASSDWVRSAGPAQCRAELGDLYWQGGRQYYRYLADTTFHADG